MEQDDQKDGKERTSLKIYSGNTISDQDFRQILQKLLCLDVQKSPLQIIPSYLWSVINFNLTIIST